MQRLDPVRALREGFAKLRMLIVGVNYYQDQSLRSLSYAVNDCEAFSEALSAATSEFQNCDIITHTGMEGESPFSIIDLQASLDRLLDNLQPQDTFLFYFSGHGVLDPVTQQLYLCLPQTQVQDLAHTGLSISAVLKQIKASQVGKQVLILDACHSGSVTFSGLQDRDATPRSQFTPAPIPEPDPNLTPKLEETLTEYKSGIVGSSVCALLSCSSHQKSWELDDLEHGVFTYYLVEGVRGSAENEHGHIEVDQLFKFVRNRTEQHLRPKGKSQTPNRIAAGSHDIIIGLGEGDSSIGIDGLAPEEEYRRRVRQALLEQRELEDPEIRQSLARLARNLLLSEEGSAQLREQAKQNLSEVLQNHKQEAIELLCEQGQSNSDLFVGLRSRLRSRLRRIWKQNLKQETFKRMLEPVEEEAKAYFQEYKNDYLVRFSREIHQQPTLAPEQHQELRLSLTNLGFSNEVIVSFEAEAWTALAHHQQTYRQEYRVAIYQCESPEAEALCQLQQQLGLGDSFVHLIEAEEDTLCDQHQRDYRQDYRQAIHAELSPAHIPDRRGLGDEIIDRIQAEENARFDQHKLTYRQRYTQAIRQQIRLRPQDSREIQEVQQQCGFSSEIVEAVEAQEDIDFNQDKQAYRNAYCTALHQEQPLSADSLDRLLQQQTDLNLGTAIVEILQAEAVETFEQNHQCYLREYVGTIRQREKLTPGDRQRLVQSQQRLGLSNQVVDWIAQTADTALEEDKRAYREALEQEARYPNAGAEERLQQVRRGCELGEELILSLEKQVDGALVRDRQQYCDAVESELRHTYPLTEESARWLQQLQQQLRLGDVMAAEVQKAVIQNFEGRQEEERKQEEARRQEEKNQEEERRQEEAGRATPVSVSDAPFVPLEDEVSVVPSSERPAEDKRSGTPIVIPPRKFPLKLAIVGLGVMGAIGLGAWAYLRYQDAQTNQAVQQERDRIAELKTKQDFQGCVDAASKFPAKAQFQADVQSLLNQCKSDLQDQGLLNQVEAFEKSGKWKDAFAAALKIRPNSSLYAQAVKRLNQLSEKFLKFIDEKYLQVSRKSEFDNLDKELNEIVAILPKDNQVTQGVSKKKKDLSDEWNRNENILAQISGLIASKKYEEAKSKLQKELKILGREILEKDNLWQKRLKPYLTQISEGVQPPKTDPAGSAVGGGTAEIPSLDNQNPATASDSTAPDNSGSIGTSDSGGNSSGSASSTSPFTSSGGATSGVEPGKKP